MNTSDFASKSVDPEQLQKLDEAVDDACLGQAQGSADSLDQLAARLAPTDGRARSEVRQLAALHHALHELRVPVAEGFTDQVMARIAEQRAAASSSRVAVSWLVAAGVLTTLLLVTVWLAAGAGSGDAFATLADMAVATTTAGAGLLGATWKGIGTIAGSWLQASPLTFFAAVLAVIGAQVLLLRRIHRSRRAGARARSDS